MALRPRPPGSPAAITPTRAGSSRTRTTRTSSSLGSPQLDARVSEQRVGSVEEDVSFAFPLSPPLVPRRSTADSEEDEMRCRRASSLASGFYSVGIGAPHTKAASSSASVSATLSPSLRFLEHLSMEMCVVPGGGNGGMKKQFALTVHHNQTKASWRHVHSYDEYRVLQDRLLALMEQGHFCMAECPWLYTFLRRSFPKPPPTLSLFGLLGQSEKAVDDRRIALLRTLVTLQSVLLNAQNHSCEILTHSVATELVAFLYGDESTTKAKSPVTNSDSPVDVRPWEVASPKVDDSTRGFSVSSARLSEDDQPPQDESATDSTTTETNEFPSEPPVCCSMCALQAKHPDEQIFADWHTDATKPTPNNTQLSQTPTPRNRNRSSSSATLLLSQFETPTDSVFFPRTPPGSPPPLVPENAILSPPRHYYLKKKKKEISRPSKRFSLSVSTLSVFHSLRQRVVSPSVQGSYAA